MDPFVGLYVILFLLLPVWFLWAVIFVSDDPSEEILHTKRAELLGPGGPDDPFALYDERLERPRATLVERTQRPCGLA